MTGIRMYPHKTDFTDSLTTSQRASKVYKYFTTQTFI